MIITIAIEIYTLTTIMIKCITDHLQNWHYIKISRITIICENFLMKQLFYCVINI